MANPSASLLQQAWLARWNQRIEQAMGGLADVQTAAGWNDLLPELLVTCPREEREFLAEALLLKASLLRAQGQRRRGSALLQKICTRLDALSEPRGFRLLYELGLDHWIDLSVAPALEFFLLAERKARNPVERACALSNVLWCLESLDLAREEVETRLANELREIGTCEVTHLEEQWHAYLLRKSFYQKLDISSVDSVKGQSSFFRQWASSLPYMGGKNLSLSLSAEYIWQGGYRTRTLAGIWVPSDREVVRSGDAIDRLYLWTWLWMAGRTEITQEKLFYTLESVLQDLDLELQSKENLLLLRNSLGWIQLLEPLLGSRFQKTLSSLRQVSGERYPALEAEHFLIQRLSPQSDSADLEIGIRRFPVFGRILKEIRSGEGPALLPLAKERLQPYAKFAGGNAIVVDRLRQEIRMPDGALLRSPALVKLFAALEKRTTVDFSLLDAEADPTRVYNLVARARKITSPKALLIRGREVMRGSEWPEVTVANAAAMPELKGPVAGAARAKFVNSPAHFQAARALLPEEFDRRAVEKKLRVSKATACRMIECWLSEERITRSGNAKATVYSWKAKEMSL